MRPLNVAMIPLCADNGEALLESMSALKADLERGINLDSLAKKAHEQFKRQNIGLTVAILGHDYAEVTREIDFALKGLPRALEKRLDWMTPLGSYFTPHPLGSKSKVAFVFPGAFNSYPGIGRDLFYLFPGLFEKFNLAASLNATEFRS